MKKTISIALAILMVCALITAGAVNAAAESFDYDKYVPRGVYSIGYTDDGWGGKAPDNQSNNQSYDDTVDTENYQDTYNVPAAKADVAEVGSNDDDYDEANEFIRATRVTTTVYSDTGDDGKPSDDTDEIIENDTDDIIENDVVPDKTNDDDKTTGDTDKVEDATEPSTKEDTAVTETTAETTASTEAPTVTATTAKSNTPVKTNNPKTGDSVWIIVSLLTAAVLGASVLVIYRKRAKSK